MNHVVFPLAVVNNQLLFIRKIQRLTHEAGRVSNFMELNSCRVVFCTAA